MYGKLYNGKRWRWSEDARKDSIPVAEMLDKHANILLDKGYAIPEIDLMLHSLVVDLILNLKLDDDNFK